MQQVRRISRTKLITGRGQLHPCLLRREYFVTNPVERELTDQYKLQLGMEHRSTFTFLSVHCIDRQRHYQRNQKSVLPDQLWIVHPSSQGKKIQLYVNLLSTCTVNYSRLSVREIWDLKLSSESRGVGQLFPLFPSQITVVLEHYYGTARQPQFQLYVRKEKKPLMAPTFFSSKTRTNSITRDASNRAETDSDLVGRIIVASYDLHYIHPPANQTQPPAHYLRRCYVQSPMFDQTSSQSEAWVHGDQ